MKNIIRVKKYILFALLALLFSINLYAADYEPACGGGTANAYLTRCNLGTVTIDYYNNEKFVCSETLTGKNYFGICPNNQGFTIINSGSQEQVEGIGELTEMLQFMAYFIIAVTVAGVFIKGIEVMNS